MRYEVYYELWFVQKELGIKVDEIKFVGRDHCPDPSVEAVGYTQCSEDGKFTVYFWLDEIMDVFITNGANFTCDIYGLVRRLARHEFRHVWQYQNAWGMTAIDSVRPYFLQVREADANKYALGLNYAKSPEEYMEEVQYCILT